MLIEVDENVVLGPILRISPEFANFYEKERKIKLGLIWWFRDFDLLDGIIACAEVFEDAIYYGKSPTSLEDAQTMAHEIMHLVRYQESGFLEIRHVPLALKLAPKLSSMLEDPIVDSVLQKNYNFDLRIFYLSAIDYCRKNVKEETADDLSRLINGVDLAMCMLRWDLIDQDLRSDWLSYLKWYRELQPISYDIGLEIANLVRVKGPSTIERQREIVKEIIKRYNLHGIISV